MKTNNDNPINNNTMSDWVTVNEAVKINNKFNKNKITVSDIYRHALQGNIRLSFYFQSPIILRKVKIKDNKVVLHSKDDSLLKRLCFLDKNSFIDNMNLAISTQGKYIHTKLRIIDTALMGFEYVIIQKLLARSLHINPPVKGAFAYNFGFFCIVSSEIFQLFEIISWKRRIKKQIIRLPNEIAAETFNKISSENLNEHSSRAYFPIYKLPSDAYLVIRLNELTKLISNQTKHHGSSTRTSTPLSRLFWLSCKHNEIISPLIKHPYKLLSIFEQWAMEEGITDHLSGDTLKSALERGSPPSASSSNQ